MNLVGGFSTQIILNKHSSASRQSGWNIFPPQFVHKQKIRKTSVFCPSFLDLCLWVGAQPSPCCSFARPLVPDHDHNGFFAHHEAQNQSIQVTLREKLTVRNAENPNLFSNRTSTSTTWVDFPASYGRFTWVYFLFCNLIFGWHGFGSLGNPWKTPRLTALRLAGAMLQGARRGKDLSPTKGWCFWCATACYDNFPPAIAIKSKKNQLNTQW